MITLVIIMSAFLAGMLAGGAGLWYVLPARSKLHVDYKQRWEEAVALLESGGQLSGEQVTELRGEKKQEPQSQLPPAVSSSWALRTMATWDRAAIEIERADKGLPPADDLRGMASWDIAKVMKARARAEMRKGI